MARTDLAYMRDYDYEIVNEPQMMYYPKREYIEKNPFEQILKSKMQRDFQEFIIASEDFKIEQRLKDYEKSGKITIHKQTYEDDTPISEKTKAFFVGLATGIGLMMMLL